ncbi:glycosyltransferase [Lishizhenia sp.]|uniref:glycosyltransferase n=1 Tax=Lishizhenia sp. TaxID=2497594 RepID=UPI00299D1BEA|nr:glycosyltransferase [Lishizhenia sp.]MDX1447303.1 glycosyltransferase [Lishizhenia sp.]
MKVSVIVSYYKNLENLKLILFGFNRQSSMDFEVIIYDDDNNEETREFLETSKGDYSFPIQHVHQAVNDGFRKNEMLNKSIQIACGNLLVFIDGDCVPHSRFVECYIKEDEPGTILSGRRVNLGEAISKELLASMDFSSLTFLKLKRTDSYKVKESIYFPFFHLSTKLRGLMGCNWGVRKEYLVQVNGYDEDYKAAGVGEDTDIEWRLEAIGLKKKSMRNKAIIYHIYHPRSYGEDAVAANFKMMAEKKAQNLIVCANGIKKL